jgi:AraC-like DNA-binding protein
MDELLDELRRGLAGGPLAPSGWSGVSAPTPLARASGLWISHGTARRYGPGMTNTSYVNPLWEWAAVLEGTLVLATARRTYTVAAPSTYIVPPGLHLGVQVHSQGTLLAWFMVDGTLAADAFAACGGRPGEVTIGSYMAAQADRALRITRLLYERPAGLSILLQAELWGFLAVQAGAAAGDQPPAYSAEIARVVSYLDSHVGEAPQTNAALARLAALAPASFRRRFAAEVGMPPRRYQVRQRLRHAKRLLMSENLSIKAVAHDLGFADQLYFSRLFARHEGVSPATYRHRFAAERGWRVPDGAPRAGIGEEDSAGGTE